METPSDWVSAVQERVSQQKEEIVTLPCLRKMTSSFLDPESEFGSLVEALNGEVISISATSRYPSECTGYGFCLWQYDKNPLIEKSEFILSLFEQLVGAGNLSGKGEIHPLTAAPQMCTGNISEAVTKGSADLERTCTDSSCSSRKKEARGWPCLRSCSLTEV